jgi:hypothetical protein
LLSLLLALSLQASVVSALCEPAKPFPAHWGAPPRAQTRDYVEWPDGYGHGSSTVARWIEGRLEQDRANSARAARVVYANEFAAFAPGSVPDEFLVLNGDFRVQAIEGNKCLVLPGTPLETFGLLFGPAAVEGLDVSARIQSESKGRLRPTFGIGLNGVGGFRLVVTPSKRVAELYRGAEDSGDRLASTPFDWESGTWTRLRLRVSKTGDRTWRVDSKVWQDGSDEPDDWAMSHETTTEPIPGRPSLWGSPFSGKPIRYDDLEVRSLASP